MTTSPIPFMSVSNTSRWRNILAALLLVTLGLSGGTAFAQDVPAQGQPVGPQVPLQVGPVPNMGQAFQMQPPMLEEWFGPQRLTNTMALFLLFTVLTLAPAIIIMTTCFVRIVIVLSITRQALGTQQLPPNSVLTTIAIFMTFHVMEPVGHDIYVNAVIPYSEGKLNADELVHNGLQPIRDFMAEQIELTGNQDDIWLFIDFRADINPDTIQTYDDVPLSVMLPAFLLSEMKTAFLIGFQLFLPFLVIDMAISSILVSMGMMMLPPVLISLPFKLLLFVLVDGWRLITDTLLVSFTAADLTTGP